MIFVDTSAWYAAFIPSDPNYETMNAWLESHAHQLVTSDFVIDELITLMTMRSERSRCARVREYLIEEKTAHIEFVSRQDFMEAWDVHSSFRDKNWSFTDCTSRVIMERLGIRAALSLDNDFRQFGTISVFP